MDDRLNKFDNLFSVADINSLNAIASLIQKYGFIREAGVLFNIQKKLYEVVKL